MECFTNSRMEKPCLYSCDGIITEVNNEFTDFTGFTMDELVCKSLVEIGDMLKINSQLILDNMNSKYSGFIFTKFMEAREVNISLSYDKEINKKIHTFYEKRKSRIEDKFVFEDQLFLENTSSIAIYSVPDLILLKANKRYIDFRVPPFNKYNNSIGKPISEIIQGYSGSELEFTFNTVLETEKTGCTKEFRFDGLVRSRTYWDSILTPVFENGKIKYIIETIKDVTEKVLKDKNIERQKKIIEAQKEELNEKNIQLEEQNAQLNSILENLSEGVAVTDSKGKYILVNPEAKRLIFQFDKENTLGESSKNIKYCDMEGNQIPFENLPVVRALKGESVKNDKLLIRHPDKDFFTDISASPIYNINGVLTNVVTCIHDITETILQSKKIEEQKKELDAVIENITDGIYIFDNKGQYKLFNKSAREIFFPHDEYLNNIGDWESQSEFYGIDGQKIDSENFPARRVIRGEKFKNTRVSMKLPNKTLQMDVSGTPIYDEKGDFSLGVFCCRDMTGYYKQEEILRSRNDFLNRLIDNLEVPVIGLSCQDLKVLKINQKAFDILKIFRPDIKSAVEIKGNTVTDIFTDFEESEYFQNIKEVLKEKKTKYLNKKKIFINGNEIYWNIIFEPMFEGNGELKEILILIIDVTAEIKSNIVMEKTLESHEEFLANISHELKTPLNIIFSTAQLLNMYCNSDSLDERRSSIIKYIESIKQNSYRLSKLINNIIDLSKIKAGFYELNLSNNNIVEVVEEIVMSVTNFTEIKGVNITFDTDTEEKIIACDPEKIERIVLNLVSNAIKFSDVGDEIFVDIKDNNEFVEISVKDNGIGIEANDLDMIFDRFKQVDKSLSRNAEGTGIGLSLVKSFVELHGGSINVESKFGEGSKFIVVLPSRKVVEENMLCSSKIRNKGEIIQAELSDVCS